MSKEPPKGAPGDGKAPGGKTRQRHRRQAEALRRNLKKRKEQARARQNPNEKPGAGMPDGN